MDTLEAIRTRRSIRSFQTKEVPKELIKKLIEAGNWAPSGRGEYPWHFVVVTNPETKRKIGELAGKHIIQAPVCIVVCCKEAKYFLEDGSAATQNMLLAAKSLNLGSCWVAGHKKPYCEEMKRILQIPKEYQIISLIPVGYPKFEPQPHDRKSLSEVLHWERF